MLLLFSLALFISAARRRRSVELHESCCSGTKVPFVSLHIGIYCTAHSRLLAWISFLGPVLVEYISLAPYIAAQSPLFRILSIFLLYKPSNSFTAGLAVAISYSPPFSKPSRPLLLSLGGFSLSLSGKRFYPRPRVYSSSIGEKERESYI